MAASVCIHGYHYGIEDEAIYLPAIKAHLNPALYPHDAIFFELQTRPMLFDELVAATARVLHLAVDWTVFGYYLATLLAFFAGLWAIAGEAVSRRAGALGRSTAGGGVADPSGGGNVRLSGGSASASADAGHGADSAGGGDGGAAGFGVG